SVGGRERSWRLAPGGRLGRARTPARTGPIDPRRGRPTVRPLASEHLPRPSTGRHRMLRYTQRKRAAELLSEHGTTYAEQAGITLTDKPSPLYRLLVLSTLLSTRIDAQIAVAAARELSSAKMRTPQRMVEATWQQPDDALGRGHYRRYDESTATRLGDGARLLLDTYLGDLRRLRDAADDTAGILRRLQDFPGIGPTGA